MIMLASTVIRNIHRTSRSRITTISALRHYTLALTRDVPTTFTDALSAHSEAITNTVEDVSMEIALKQHDHYVSTMRSILPTLSIEGSPLYPDCVFIEDTAVVINKKGT